MLSLAWDNPLVFVLVQPVLFCRPAFPPLSGCLASSTTTPSSPPSGRTSPGRTTAASTRWEGGWTLNSCIWKNTNSGGFWVFCAGTRAGGIPSSGQIFAQIHQYDISSHSSKYSNSSAWICLHIDIFAQMHKYIWRYLQTNSQVGEGEVAVHGLSLEGAQWDEVNFQCCVLLVLMF